MKNTTALVSCFARAGHYKLNSEWIFKDEVAQRILSQEEYDEISSNMIDGISYFAPDFKGSKEEALQFIVDHRLAPSVLTRSAFCEQALDNALLLGCKQYVLFASGYDTYSFRTKTAELHLFELDLPEMIEDKVKRIKRTGLKEQCPTVHIPCDLSQDSWGRSVIENGFNQKKQVLGSLLGISYYLSKEDFKGLLKNISELWCDGSSICFDYPTYGEGIESINSRELANAAGEQMQAKYSYEEIESLLSDCGFLIYEHHDKESATKKFFEKYNNSNPNPNQNPNRRMSAPDGVNYCFAVRKML